MFTQFTRNLHHFIIKYVVTIGLKFIHSNNRVKFIEVVGFLGKCGRVKIIKSVGGGKT